MCHADAWLFFLRGRPGGAGLGAHGQADRCRGGRLPTAGGRVDRRFPAAFRVARRGATGGREGGGRAERAEDDLTSLNHDSLSTSGGDGVAENYAWRIVGIFRAPV